MSEIKQFNEKLSKQLFNLIKKLKSPVVSLGEDEIGEVFKQGRVKHTSPVFITDKANVVLLEAITQESKLILINFVEETNLTYPVGIINELKSKSEPLKGFSFTPEYLNIVLKIFFEFEDPIKFYVSDGKPMLIENKHFRALIAPRMDGGGING